MAESIATQKNDAAGVPHNNGRLVTENSGQFGVSDQRRAQLSQMEQDAGVQHEAADEGVPSRGEDDNERAAGPAPERGAARLGDRD